MTACANAITTSTLTGSSWTDNSYAPTISAWIGGSTSGTDAEIIANNGNTTTYTGPGQEFRSIEVEFNDPWGPTLPCLRSMVTCPAAGALCGGASSWTYPSVTGTATFNSYDAGGGIASWTWSWNFPP